MGWGEGQREADEGGLGRVGCPLRVMSASEAWPATGPAVGTFPSWVRGNAGWVPTGMRLPRSDQVGHGALRPWPALGWDVAETPPELYPAWGRTRACLYLTGCEGSVGVCLCTALPTVAPGVGLYPPPSMPLVLCRCQGHPAINSVLTPANQG